MDLRRLRLPLLMAALCLGGSSACFAHGALSGAGLSIQSLAGPAAGSGHAVGLMAATMAAVLTLAGLSVGLRALWSRRRGVRTRGQLRRGLSGLTAGALLALWVWVLPWLSFHETHHALQADEPACAVAQIVHSQSGGIVPALPALALPPIVATVSLPESVVLSARIVPEPAARSPPV